MTFSTFEEKLRDYLRKYPSIIDHTTCLSFTDWPEAALKEVANKKLLMANLIVQENNKKPKEEEKKRGRRIHNATFEEETKEAKISMLLGISDIFA